MSLTIAQKDSETALGSRPILKWWEKACFLQIDLARQSGQLSGYGETWSVFNKSSSSAQNNSPATAGTCSQITKGT